MPLKFVLGCAVGAVVTAGILLYFQGSFNQFFAIDQCVKAGGTFNYQSNACVSATSTPALPETDLSMALPEILSRATLTIPESAGTVTLSGGAGEFDDGSGLVTLGEVRTLFIDGGLPYGIAPVFISRGGSGTFVYIGLFTIENRTATAVDLALLGDRIAVDSIEAEGVGVRVTYRDRKPGEPMATPPSDAKQIYYTVKDGTLASSERVDGIITVTSPKPGDTITSPLTVTGEARGNWFFEASFPATLVDWDGKIIAEVPIQAKGDWMTENYVPFEGTITFPAQSPGSRGTLILKKDNPSGLPENDKAIEIPILYK